MHFTSIGRSNYLDYLEKESTERACWQGKAAEKLELKGQPVCAQDFKLLCAGIDPVSGEVLRAREQHFSRQNEKAWRRPTLLYDGTFPASKSVSAMALVDERISLAHRESVRAVLPVMESLAMVRDGRTRELVKTGNALYAVFEHHANRAQEPHEHAHIAVMNLTFDEERGRWYALAAYEMYRAGTPMQERYREILAERVSAMGYGIVPRADREGWEIEGVSPTVMEKFSQRMAERDEAIAAFSAHHGRVPTPKERAVLVRTSREDKEIVPAAELRERQLERLNPAERESLVGVKELALERYVPREVEYESWRPNPYRMEPHAPPVEPEKRVKPPSLDDHVDQEPEKERHRWTYGKEKVRPVAYS